MDVLIIGSEGFIGQYLTEHFLRQGHAVFCADAVETARNGYYWLRQPATDCGKLMRQRPYDVCINAAGRASVAASFTNPTADFLANTCLVFYLLDAMRQYNPGCKFINLSSAAVYGAQETERLAENSPQNPASPYGYHKKLADGICREFASLYALQTCSARLFSVYGVGQRKMLLWDLYQKSLQQNAIELEGSGAEQRDFIYIADVAVALQYLIEQHPFDGSAINIGNGTGITVKQVADIFASLCGQPLTITFKNNGTGGNPAHLVAHNGLLLQYGYQPTVTLRQGIINYLQWLKESG